MLRHLRIRLTALFPVSFVKAGPGELHRHDRLGGNLGDAAPASPLFPGSAVETVTRSIPSAVIDRETTGPYGSS